MIDNVNKNMSEKGIAQINDTQDLNFKSVWSRKRKKLGVSRTCSRGNDAIRFWNVKKHWGKGFNSGNFRFLHLEETWDPQHVKPHLCSLRVSWVLTAWCHYALTSGEADVSQNQRVWESLKESLLGPFGTFVFPDAYGTILVNKSAWSLYLIP